MRRSYNHGHLAHALRLYSRAPRVYLHSSVVKMELGYIVWGCSFPGLKFSPHTGKSPRQGTDHRLLHDLMKQEISLAASTSTWPEIKVKLYMAILFWHACSAGRCRARRNRCHARFVFSLCRHARLHCLLFMLSFKIHIKNCESSYEAKPGCMKSFLKPFLCILPYAQRLMFPLYLYTCMWYTSKTAWTPFASCKTAITSTNTAWQHLRATLLLCSPGSL